MSGPSSLLRAAIFSVLCLLFPGCSGEITGGASGDDAGDVSAPDLPETADSSQEPLDTGSPDTPLSDSASEDAQIDTSEPEEDTAVPTDTGPSADASRDAAVEDADAESPDAPTPDADGDVADDAAADTDPPVTGSLSELYPGDDGMASDPSVLFFDDFEGGWGAWNAPTDDTRYLTLETDASMAHAGQRYLRSTVTTADLDENQYISASPRAHFDRRVDEIFWRLYVRFPVVAPNPHHWIRVAAGDETWNSSGLANTVPEGDRGFWFDFDINNDDVFDFYVYWYLMRSGRCNDGTAIPGCAGDQGTTYYYGNVFRPPDQTPFQRDQWFCIELRAKANTVGESDGELSFWVDDQLVGDYRQGYPDGTWLRAQFHTGGCTFSACTDPVPFEGFDFRSSAAVGFKSVFLDAYYQRDTSAQKRQVLEDRGLTVSDEQTILYDDIVVATRRIGCRR